MAGLPVVPRTVTVDSKGYKATGAKVEGWKEEKRQNSSPSRPLPTPTSPSPAADREGQGGRGKAGAPAASLEDPPLHLPHLTTSLPPELAMHCCHHPRLLGHEQHAAGVHVKAVQHVRRPPPQLPYQGVHHTAALVPVHQAANHAQGLSNLSQGECGCNRWAKVSPLLS
ncbi:hypothetical protein HaLaN_02982 [Haematococcus lacustris]|uniref:Uncharacterized protein n=1 Tax=Haematococcus lacustris TaxID=44745 RepID=A0A699YFM4_HAELA|nr:hypothetical protein HaLaN_02982 [Haematococcus lacustris]